MKKSNFKRLVIQKNGKYYQTPYATDGVEAIDMPITNNRALKKSQINNCPIIEESNYKSLNSNNMHKMSNLPYGVIRSETATGGASMARNETPSTVGAKKKITLILSNTDKENQHSLIVGDHHGYGWDESGIAALSPLVKVGGTFKDLTLAKIKQASGANPHDLHGLHLTSFQLELSEPTGSVAQNNFVAPKITKRIPSGIVFESGELATIDADPAGNSNKRSIIPLFESVDNGSFNSHFRKMMDWRYLLDGYNGIQVDLPPASELVLNFYLNGVARTYAMNKV